MSHHLFTKQVWIMLVAAILFTGVFFGGVYFWFNDVQRYILEAENAAEQVEPNGQDGISKKMVEAQDTAMTPFQNGKNLNQIEQEIEFPCLVQIVDGEIGVFHRKGRCMKTLRQSGEYLSIADEQILSQGIPVNDEKELIIVLESYHLQ